MLGKILVTLAVIVIAVLVVKQRKDVEAGKQQRSPVRTEGDVVSPMSKDLRFAAYLFLVIMFGTGAFIYYQRWQDDHTVLTVNLYRDDQSEPITYQVYKSELDSRSFTTINGIRITVADSERMEVTGLDLP